MKENPLDCTYEIVAESVAAENVEGEVVIVHFDSGNYFSLRGGAVEVWEELMRSVMPCSVLPLVRL